MAFCRLCFSYYIPINLSMTFFKLSDKDEEKKILRDNEQNLISV